MRTENVAVQNALLLFVEVEFLIQNNKLDNEFYSNYELLYSKAEKLKAEGRREESDKINKKMYIKKKPMIEL